VVVVATSAAAARARALRALDELRLRGPQTNRATLLRVLHAPELSAHTFPTALVGSWAAPAAASHPDAATVAVAVLQWAADPKRVPADVVALGVTTIASRSRRLGAVVLAAEPQAAVAMVADALRDGDGDDPTPALAITTATLTDAVHVRVLSLAGPVGAATVNGRLVLFAGVAPAPERLPSTVSAAKDDGTDDTEAVRAPAAAIVREVLVAAGAEVAAGAPVAVLSVMKTDVVLTVPRAARIRQVHVHAGDAVRRGVVLVRLDPPAYAAPPVAAPAASSGPTDAGIMATRRDAGRAGG
jgi:acetyl/propionyl-CoA carboxylase alpha subunit